MKVETCYLMILLMNTFLFASSLFNNIYFHIINGRCDVQDKDFSMYTAQTKQKKQQEKHEICKFLRHLAGQTFIHMRICVCMNMCVLFLNNQTKE